MAQSMAVSADSPPVTMVQRRVAEVALGNGAQQTALVAFRLSGNPALSSRRQSIRLRGRIVRRR